MIQIVDFKTSMNKWALQSLANERNINKWSDAFMFGLIDLGTQEKQQSQ